ncbi:hypothetical protein ABT071_13915 [Streptomyces sp. NPDC002506]|uniref:hypothetical protein n=1 Tax=Streptomyces sp. NPDC002506 TaxID=3154536 RepID=UPI0033278197
MTTVNNPSQGEPGNRRARSEGNGQFVRTDDTARRDAQAAALRSEGKTFEHIATTLGYADKGCAWRGVRRARRDAAIEPVTQLVETESAELDDLYARALEILDRHHITVQQGRVVTMLDADTGREVPIPDDGPKLQALLVALKIRQAYQDLHGLKAEKKLNISGGVRYEIVGIDPADLT